MLNDLLPLSHRIERDRTLILLFLSSLVLLPSIANAQQGFTHRLTGILYDYDNNGTPDATSTVTYDGAGRAIGVTYTYTDDGTPDLFNTEDDDAASEVSVIEYNADDLIEVFEFDRVVMPSGVESDDTTNTFTGGMLTRFDTTSVLNGSTSSFYGDFTYASGLLSSVAVRDASTDSIIILQNYSNGGNGLPSTLSILAGITTTVDLNWRTDGQLDDLSSTTVFGATQLGAGTANYTYDANGQIQSEVWTADVGTGAHFAEFVGETYRKTYSYDTQLLKTVESIDIDDDGSVEATRTYAWTPGSCVPGFIFAPNGRPNFAEMTDFPFKPGTGATWLENCGPYLVGGSPPPVPGLAPLAWLPLVGGLVLVGRLFATRSGAVGGC